MSDAELAAYIGELHQNEPDLRKRVEAIAKRHLGQPYDIYLLGEYPFEIYDDQPLSTRKASDCVVFVEHTYAMALSHDWPTFFATLQRIRYADGRIGLATRNHYAEAHWNPNNGWLIADITEQLAGDAAVSYTQKVDLARFLRRGFELETDIPVEEVTSVFLPHEQLDRALPKLQTGDLVQIVRGKNDGYWIGHFGLAEVEPKTGEVWFIHSGRPEVRRVLLADYAADAVAANPEKAAQDKAQFYGFKFLRLADDPLANLRKLDGPHAPVVTFAPNAPWK